MALSPKVAKWLGRFYPGLATDIAALGPGDFSVGPFGVTPDGDDCIKGVRLELEYSLEDGHTIKIIERLALKSGCRRYVPGVDPVAPLDWEPIYYRLWYGRTLADSTFRFELHGFENGPARHHVHITVPEHADHVPSEEFDPDPTNMDPREFIKLVRKYREDNTYPVVWKTRS